MKFIYAQDFQQLSHIAGDMIEQYIVDNPNCVLGLATGSTPLGLYKYLIAGYIERGISYHGVTTFNLDAYGTRFYDFRAISGSGSSYCFTKRTRCTRY